MEITSLDLSFLAEEFNTVQQGYVQKVYQRDNEFSLRCYAGEKKELVVKPNQAYFTEYSKDNPQRPPGFCMELRKHLGSIDEIKQRKFDRILEIKSGEYKFVAELFGKGNACLVKNGTVIGALRQEEWNDRKTVVGEKHAYPEPAPNPFEMEDFVKNLSEGDLVRSLASDISLGGVYAEEICARCSLQKKQDVGSLSKQQKQLLNEEIQNMIDSDKDPVLYRDADDPIRAFPFEMQTYLDYDSEHFNTFSEAIDELNHVKKVREKKKQLNQKYREEKEGLERQLQQQNAKIQGLRKAADERRNKAEKIYENYKEFSEAKNEADRYVEENSMTALEEENPGKVVSVDRRNEVYKISVNGVEIRTKPTENLEATASRLYDEAKEREQKAEKAEEAKKRTKQKIEELEPEEIELEEDQDSTKDRNKKWFESYRWFYTPNNRLVVVGRGPQTNESLVKKHMEKNDLYFHADFDGAPSVVLKDGKDAGEEDKLQAAKAALIFSKSWKTGIRADDVYCVEPSQVTKSPETGEYLQKGAFVIKGERNYFRNVSIDCGIGTYQIENDVFVPMAGPVKSIEANCDEYVVLSNGKTKKSSLAKEIKSALEDENIMLDEDYLVRALPPGRSSFEG